jgi:sigma-E factor negative regulatory protein RseA
MNEQLSALMDSELTEAETLRLLGMLKNDVQLKQSWDRYHLLGDALRKTPQISSDFSAKVMRRLASEPTVLAPRRKAKPAAQRFALPLAASFAAVSLVGLLTWQMTQMNQADPSLARLASAPSLQQVAMTEAAPAQSKVPQRVAFSSATSRSYLLAHQEFSPSYTMEGFPTYVRTLSEQQESNP